MKMVLNNIFLGLRGHSDRRCQCGVKLGQISSFGSLGGHICSRVQANPAGLIRAVDQQIYNRCCTLVHQKSQSPAWKPRSLSHWNVPFNSCRLFLRVCCSAGFQVRGSIGRNSWAFFETHYSDLHRDQRLALFLHL
jgi:hypothetical protein